MEQWPSDVIVRVVENIAKFNTLQFYHLVEIAKFYTREIWLLIFREI